MTAAIASPAGPELLLRRLCDISAAIGGVILVSMACMTVVSVVGRSAFAHPILGDVELVQLGCAVVVSSFLPYTQFRRANIIVDFFTARASARAQRLMDAAGTLLYTLVLALVCWRVAAGGIDNGPPGLRPHYHPNYYGAFVLDPDGHNIEAVCHKPG